VTERVTVCVLIVARDLTKEITVFWDVTCNLVEVCRHFEGTCCVPIQNRRNELFLYLEVGGNKSFEMLVSSKRLHSVILKRQQSVYSQQ